MSSVAITVDRNLSLTFVAAIVEHFVFGAALKGKDAKAVETWYPRFDRIDGDLNQQNRRTKNCSEVLGRPS